MLALCGPFKVSKPLGDEFGEDGPERGEVRRDDVGPLSFGVVGGQVLHGDFLF